MKTWMQSLTGTLLTLLLLSSVSFCLSSCGDASKSSKNTSGKLNVSSTSAEGKSLNPDVSVPTGPNGPKDSEDGDRDVGDDDYEFVDFGHEAGAAEKRIITKLVKTYYAAAAADNGAAACSRIFSITAVAIVEDYGGAAGPADLRGKSCRVVETKTFRIDHRIMAMKSASLEILRVRTKGKKGIVLLRFGPKARLRYLPLWREYGVWKVYSISDDSPLP